MSLAPPWPGNVLGQPVVRQRFCIRLGLGDEAHLDFKLRLAPMCIVATPAATCLHCGRALVLCLINCRLQEAASKRDSQRPADCCEVNGQRLRAVVCPMRISFLALLTDVV